MRDVMALRDMLIRHTGWQIGELRIVAGYWVADTAFGPMRVNEILRMNKHPGVGRDNYY